MVPLFQNTAYKKAGALPCSLLCAWDREVGLTQRVCSLSGVSVNGRLRLYIGATANTHGRGRDIPKKTVYAEGLGTAIRAV